MEVACLLQSKVFDYAVDDGGALVGKFAGGGLLTMNVAYNCPDKFPRRTLEIVGTKAMAIARNTMGQTPGGTLTLIDATFGHSSEVEILLDEDVSPFQAQVEAFSRCLLDGQAFPFTPEGDLHTMRLLQAAQSQAGGVLVGEGL